ncbi:MAG: HAD family hydrolase [Candidatus Nomurabacteria bacterium]|nr:MAG: HAD family hydrolase [Candidatus Nomurabacteria bacterium]
MNEGQKIRWYAFDFDGVIAEYEGFKGKNHFGKPNKVIVETIRRLKEMGHKIIVYSTRGEEFLKKYCSDNNIPADYFNKNPELEGDNPGKPIAYVYVDDRAVCYKGQESERLLEEILSFKAYWEK